MSLSSVVTNPSAPQPAFRLGVVGAGKISQIILPILPARGIRVVGFPVLCEKPWVMNWEEARQLVNKTAADRAKGVVVAAFSSRFRFTPAATVLAAALNAGKNGRPRHVRLTARISAPLPLKNLPEWKRHTGTAGGGISSDWSVYELDWLAALLGSAFDPIEVSADFDDWLREGTELDSGYEVRMRCASKQAASPWIA